MTTNSYSKRSGVALLGAFDRFNYGDLLFPIVVGNEMASHAPGTDISIHALAESDLSQFGALPTRSLRALYKSDALHAGDAIIFAGGGTIGVDWHYLHANLLNRQGNLALYYLQRVFGRDIADNLSRIYFGGRAPFPWVAGPEDFPVPVKVAYNAVGGSELGNVAPDIQRRTFERLRKASYLSVRDTETKRIFEVVEDSVAVHIAPDSAVLMSEQYPKAWLQEHANSALLDALALSPYVCFQSNLHYATTHEDLIVAALEAIHEQHGLRAMLLPIGRYVGLDDQVALRKIKARLRTPVEMVSDQASIWEIMLTIASAGLFLGTSLHGNITSQSFAVPHLGLSESPCKLDFYLESWDLPEQSRCVRLDEVHEQAGRVLAISEALRQRKRAELIGLSHENFAKLAQACDIDWQ